MRAGDRVRSTDDGQIGFLVEDETSGGLRVKIDRRGENRVVPYSPERWVADAVPSLTDMQVARICHDMDRAWRVVHGEYTLPEWNSVRETERLAWLKGPPAAADGRRRALYTGVQKLVRGL